MSQLKVASINIEGHRHLDRVVAFCQTEQPDIVNLQEVYESDLPSLATALSMEYHFGPMALVRRPPRDASSPYYPWGVAQLYNPRQLSQVQHRLETYVRIQPVGFPNFKPDFNNMMDRVVSLLEFELAGQAWRVATTHFTWTPRGNHTPEQAAAFESLKQLLGKYDDFIITGDFNSPRNHMPNENTNVFKELALMYRDHIPSSYQTSVDPDLHKAGPLQLLVDGLFSTPQYTSQNVRLVPGVSDHQAIVGELMKTN